MGKDYKKEIQNLDIIYNAALKVDISIISDFIQTCFDVPCLSIGSGGSYSVASAYEYLLTIGGGIAKRITPIELKNYEIQLKHMSAILFTAGGKNHDSLNAYQYLMESEPCAILTCCLNSNATIKKRQKENRHNYYFEYQMPIRKDGYLAVESIVTYLVLLCRAFQDVTGKPFYHVPEEFIWADDYELFAQDNSIFDKETLIVLHSGITTPAAIDLESKYTEAALGNIQLVDFRNFAHGRHFWLSDRKNSTAILFLYKKSDKSFISRMLGVIPQEIPRICFEVDDSSVLGLFQSFRYIFHIVKKAGEIHGINPGKPSVAEFGKKLYHMNYNICDCQSLITRRNDILEMAVYRKIKRVNQEDHYKYYYYAEKTIKRIFCGRYKGFIFDFDDTIFDNNNRHIFIQICNKISKFLTNGIQIGIATGRGKSIRQELQSQISDQFWNHIVIAYYNGGCIGYLGENEKPEKNKIFESPSFSLAKELLTEFANKHEIHIDGIDDNNPYQMSINKKTNNKGIVCALKECLKSNSGIKIIESGHSIDIIPATSSKTNIYKFYSELGFGIDDFISIGDAGQENGNDYELLNQSNAISVDLVSADIEHCWNILRPGYRNLEATLFILEHVTIHEDGFSIKRW